MSSYLLRNKETYYASLAEILKNKDWNTWISFFLNAVAEESEAEASSLLKLADFYETSRSQLAEKAKEIWRFPLLSPETLEVYRSAERDPAEYTLEHYEYLKGDILTLFQALRRRIMNIDPSVKEELKKLYIAFKAYTNFVDVVPQKSRLRLSLNVAFADILDPKGLCKDVSLGRWGNGDVEVGISNMNELDDIMELIQQAFDKQMEAN